MDRNHDKTKAQTHKRTKAQKTHKHTKEPGHKKHLFIA